MLYENYIITHAKRLKKGWEFTFEPLKKDIPNLPKTIKMSFSDSESLDKAFIFMFEHSRSNSGSHINIKDNGFVVFLPDTLVLPDSLKINQELPYCCK